MVPLAVTTLTGDTVPLEAATLAEFMAALRGPVLCPTDAGYEDARSIWNAHITTRPALIVRCIGVADVLASVAFARTHQLLVAVRGGGHNFPGTSLCAGGMVIDLSLMTSVRVDPRTQTARAEGGAKWGHFDRETQAFGLATTGGTDSDTGIGGLTLGGGLGWLGGKYGLACDNLIAADLVTADGQVHTASATENPELLWGLRGGCGNFGVVTSLAYQLHPVGTLVAGLVVYPFAHATEVLRCYRELAATTPDELNTACAMRTLPDGTRVVGIGVCYNGPQAAATRVLQPLQRLGQPSAQHDPAAVLSSGPASARRRDPSRPPVLWQVPLYGGPGRRGHCHTDGAFLPGLLPPQCGRVSATRQCCQPGSCGGHSVWAPRGAVQPQPHWPMDSTWGGRAAYPVGPYLVGSHGAVWHRGRLCQQRGQRGRRGCCSHACRLWHEL